VVITCSSSESTVEVLERVFGLEVLSATRPPQSPLVFSGTGKESLRDVLVRDYGFVPRPRVSHPPTTARHLSPGDEE
jgi:hypothetical protein